MLYNTISSAVSVSSHSDAVSVSSSLELTVMTRRSISASTAMSIAQYFASMSFSCSQHERHLSGVTVANAVGTSLETFAILNVIFALPMWPFVSVLRASSLINGQCTGGVWYLVGLRMNPGARWPGESCQQRSECYDALKHSGSRFAIALS